MEQDKSAKVAFFKAFNKCQGALDPVKADSTNDHFHNRYPSLAAVMDAVKPFMEAGFSFIHEGVVLGEKPFLRTSMILGDYERVSDWPLVNDGNPQHLAASSTYAKRYSISGLTGLVIDSDDDGNTAAAGVKTTTRQPAKSYVPSDSPKTLPAAPAAGSELTKFIPSDVVFVAGKGKGANKTFSKITAPDGTTYDGTEIQGQIAQSAMTADKEIVLSFENTSYGPKAKNVKINESQPDPEPVEGVPF